MAPEPGILAVDVGSGTQDILAWSPDIAMENCPKMIVPSATRILAGKVEQARRDGHHLFFRGTTMGGGPISSAVRRHLESNLQVFALEKAALTFHDDLERVAKMGIHIVTRRPDISPLTELEMADINIDSIEAALSQFYVTMPPIVAVAVQDHGFSPDASNRAFRFQQWTELLASGRGLEALVYQDPPEHLSRMRAVSRTVPGAWVGDTGPAAILGTLLDPWVAGRKSEGITVVNIGNEHTLAALVQGDRVWGIYEHHTGALDPAKLTDHLARFRTGRINHQEVFDDMGHGCLVLPGAQTAGSFEPLSITGPNREQFRSLGGHMAAPFGDMMLTGCFGLVAAVNRRMGRETEVAS